MGVIGGLRRCRRLTLAVYGIDWLVVLKYFKGYGRSRSNARIGHVSVSKVSGIIESHRVLWDNLI